MTRTLFAACIAALLGACTTGPEYQRPEVALPPVWRAPQVDAAELANTDWWHALGDPELDKLIDAALDANKDLLIATARIEEFEARLQVSRAPTMPQVGYNAAASREKRSEERPNGLRPGASPYLNNFEVGATFAWEIDVWGRIKRANEAALADLLGAQEARRAVMLSLVSNVATSYVQLLELDMRLAYARDAVRSRELSIGLLDAKYQGGSGTRIAVEQSRADFEGAAAEIPPIERDIATLENALSVLLGRNPGPVPRRKLQDLALLQLPAGTPADVLARRPDVMAAEQALIAANARIGVAQTAYFPTLKLTALLGLGSDALQWLWSETARTGQYGASLMGPIFNNGEIEGGVRQAEAATRQAALTWQQTVQTALQEVDDALVARAKAAEREAALERQVARLQEVANLARMRSEGGQGTQIDVLEAERRVYLAQSSQAQGRRDTLVAQISIYKALGGGWMVEQERRRPSLAVVGAK